MNTIDGKNESEFVQAFANVFNDMVSEDNKKSEDEMLSFLQQRELMPSDIVPEDMGEELSEFFSFADASKEMTLRDEVLGPEETRSKIVITVLEDMKVTIESR